VNESLNKITENMPRPKFVGLQYKPVN
jgi:hypothetical protein